MAIMLTWACLNFNLYLLYLCVYTGLCACLSCTSCLIKEGRKSLKLAFFQGIRDYGSQSRGHRLLVSLSAPRDILYIATLRGNKGLPEVRNNGQEISMSH